MFASLADPADLVLGTVSVLPEDGDARWRSFVSLTYWGQKPGRPSRAGSWWDHFYLSADDRFSVDDVPFRGAVSQLDTGSNLASTTINTDQDVGAVLPGNYFVIVRTNI